MSERDALVFISPCL